MRTFGVFGLLLALAISSPGQEVTIRQLYQNILAKSSAEGSLKPQVQEIDGKLDAVRTLPVAEVEAVLPLALQCTKSPNEWVRQAGYELFLSAMIRFDSAKILEPYIDELEKLSDGGDAQARGYILLVLGGLIPNPPDKAVAYLEANLENSRNSRQETLSITASLLKSSPTDTSTVHRVLAFVSAHPEADVTGDVLHQVGLYRVQLPEAISFISTNLNQDDHRLRAAAVEAVSRMDKDARAQLHGQLSQIASDPGVAQDVRQQATRALEP
jgi:hypothetical protein